LGRRTSPTTSRSGRIRSALATRSPTSRSRFSASPAAMSCGWRVSRLKRLALSRSSSAVSSTTPTRSAGSKRSVSERRNVVLPAPVSPATRKFALACTSLASSSAISVERPPSVTQSRPCRPLGSRSSRSRLNLRIDRYGPPTGGMTAFTRDPSAIRASTIGWATESSRPARAAIRSESSMSSRELPRRTSVDSRRPRRSTNTASGPFTRMSETSGSPTSGCSAPSRRPPPRRLPREPAWTRGQAPGRRGWL